MLGLGGESAGYGGGGTTSGGSSASSPDPIVVAAAVTCSCRKCSSDMRESSDMRPPGSRSRRCTGDDDPCRAGICAAAGGVAGALVGEPTCVLGLNIG